ncbi:MAG: hypothetical protein K2K54_13400 [Lachnospiraceae bacterium]|nr:hypothetical protein [Lachnospiraceae bacterium]
MDFIWDIIMEIIMTIIFEGSMEAVTEKKIPMVIRVLLAVFLLVFYIGFVGIFFYIGIKDKNGLMLGFAVFFGVIIAALVIKTYKEIKE